MIANPIGPPADTAAASGVLTTLMSGGSGLSVNVHVVIRPVSIVMPDTVLPLLLPVGSPPSSTQLAESSAH